MRIFGFLLLIISHYCFGKEFDQSVNIITGQWQESHCDLTISGPFELKIRRHYDPQERSLDRVATPWQFSTPDLLRKDYLRSKFSKLAACKQVSTHDETGRLKEIKTLKKDGACVNSVSFNYDVDGSCLAKASNGQKVYYGLDQDQNLKSVVINDQMISCYDYQSHPIERTSLIRSIAFPEKRFLNISYYDEINFQSLDPLRDFQLGKIKALRSPVGLDDTPIVTNQFEYFQDYTIVKDAIGRQTIYRFNRDFQITAVEDYSLSNELYRIQKNIWKEGNLICRALLNAKNEIFFCVLLEYDTQGQLVKESLVGNLSGQCTHPVVLEEGGVVQNGVETYSRYYSYRDGLLDKESEDNGKGTKYLYNEDQLLVAKFLLDGEKIKSRSYYEYDENRYLNKEIFDDGVSFDKEDLQGSSFRKIRETLSVNGQGLNLVTEERYYNFEKQLEEKFQTEISTYSNRGLLESQKILNHLGECKESKNYVYNEKGELIEVLDECGKLKRFVHDSLGNLLWEHDTATQEEIFNTYDFVDRLIRKEIKKEGKIQSLNLYTYDKKGNCIASIDRFGNTIETVFDEWNRPKKKIFPYVQNEEGEILQIEESCSYDIADCVISKRDAKGYETLTSYNIRQNPVHISYPDGSFEHFTYFLDGSLREVIKRDGLRTIYERDFLGRSNKEVTLSNSLEVIEEVKKEYNSLFLLKENYSSGQTKYYSYGLNGELSQVVEGAHSIYVSEEGCVESWGNFELTTKQTEEGIFKYDKEGNLRLKLDQADQGGVIEEEVSYLNPLGQRVKVVNTIDLKGVTTSQIHDALGRIVKIIKTNGFNQEIFCQEYRYDANGNQAWMRLGNLETRWRYGPMNRLESVLEYGNQQLSKETHYIYNSYGQLTQIKKPDATCIEYTYDSSGRVTALFSSDGSVDYAFKYDFCGNLTQVDDQILQTTLLRTYNDLKQLISENFDGRFLMQNAYDAMGRRTELKLPDNSLVKYCYDDCALLAVIRQDAGGFEAYRYSYKEYNLQAQPLLTEMIGGLGNCHLNRKNSHLILETPYHHLSYNFSDGEIAKISQTGALGQSVVCYDYDDASQLVEEGNFHYSYDLQGNRIQNWQRYGNLNELIEDASASYGYDRNGNLIFAKTTNAYFEYFYDALNRLIEVKQDGNLLVEYTYDCFHRRLAKKTANGLVQFLYDGPHEIGSLDEKGKFLELRILDAEGHLTLAVELQGEAFAPLSDYQGSILGLVSLKSKKIEEQYQYNSFGMQVGQEGYALNPWRYAGKRLDNETGFIFFGRRYLDPNQGRWITPDPAGYIDGMNLYTYVQNNPLTKRDFFGLSSFDSFKSFFKNLFKEVCCVLKSVCCFVKKVFSIETYEQLVAKGFLFSLGYYIKDKNAGVYGQGEASDKVRITMINGMRTNFYWLMIAVREISKSHGGVNVHYVHRPALNVFYDSLRAFMVRLGFISPHARTLADTWKELIHDMGGVKGGGSIIHYSHSIGTSETLCALKLLTDEERKMIRIYSFGSPTLTSKHASLHHFVSIRDGISFFMDPIGFFKALFGKNPAVTMVGTWQGLPFSEHLFGSKTYSDVWSAMGKTFVEFYGCLS